jgi:hypothetical protein
MTSHDRADRLEQVESQVSYHRQRLALFQSRADASRGPNSQRLHELERAYHSAQERLDLLRGKAKGN